jgi:hypothetical protein
MRARIRRALVWWIRATPAPLPPMSDEDWLVLADWEAFVAMQRRVTL